MDGELNPCSKDELAIRENFKRDYKLSCPVIDDNDIFSKCLKMSELEGEWKDYYEMSLRIGDIDDYRRKIRNKILSFISSVKGFDKLKPVDLGEQQFEGPKSYMNDKNISKNLLSIDLVRGNYQSLKYLGSQYVLDTKDYEELIRRFTKEESLVRSKMFRQMIFGQLKPEVQASVQRMMMNEIIAVVYAAVGEIPIVHFTNDEVIFEVDKKNDLVRKIKKALKHVPYQFRFETFWIYKIINHRNEPWFVKINDRNERRILGVHVRYLLQVHNFITEVDNQRKDYWWREQGRLSCLLEPEIIDGISAVSDAVVEI